MRTRIQRGPAEEGTAEKKQNGAIESYDIPKRNFGRRYGEKPAEDRERRPQRSYGERSERPHSDRPFSDRPKRSFGERSERPHSDRPFSDRPRRPFGERSERPNSDRPFSDRPKRSFGERSERPHSDRPFSDRPKRSFGERSERPHSDRPFSDRPKRSFGERSERPHSDRPFSDRPKRSFGERSERPNSDRPFSDRPRRPFGERSERPHSDRPFSDRPRRPFGERSERPRSDRPFSDRPRRSFGEHSEHSYSEGHERPYKKSPYTKKEKGETPLAKQPKNPNEVRLNKYIANSGICSRREADEYITAGLVTVNGNIITELGTKVNINDDIRFNGERLKGEKKVYIIMNKPKDFVTTTSDPHAEKNVMDLINPELCPERIFPVGRLDKSTTGILLFTNDGELTETLTHPSYNRKKIYEITLDSNLKQPDFDALLSGIELEDGLVQADALAFVGEDKSKIGMEIHSGKNRIVRRMFEHLGYNVKKLDRVYFAGLTKKNIRRGQWRFMTDAEVALLRRNED
jgi:23S rRNA pseudouridine2605 synthase